MTNITLIATPTTACRLRANVVNWRIFSLVNMKKKKASTCHCILDAP